MATRYSAYQVAAFKMQLYTFAKTPEENKGAFLTIIPRNTPNVREPGVFFGGGTWPPSGRTRLEEDFPKPS